MPEFNESDPLITAQTALLHIYYCTQHTCTVRFLVIQHYIHIRGDTRMAGRLLTIANPFNPASSFLLFSEWRLGVPL
jgi:hypothetical protein